MARLMAWIHWSLTFFGAQKDTLRAIQRLRPELETQLSARTILRKYLENKHHHFVMWFLAPTRRGRAFVGKTCRAVDGNDLGDAALAEGKGLIGLGYHFGTGRMMMMSLARIYGKDTFEIIYRTETYLQSVLPSVARLAYRLTLANDEKCGLNTIYMTPSAAPLSIIRHLRKGHVLGMAGDGFVASQFVEVPFLGGTMRFPTGVARLAALTGAPIVPIFGLLEGLESHRIIMHPAIYCENDTPEAIEETVRACTQILEWYVRRYPWAWWIWHRLQFGEHPDGRLRITVEALAPPAAPAPQPAAAAS
jgi:lauroyl/myristoyl acyltransferase